MYELFSGRQALGSLQTAVGVCRSSSNPKKSAFTLIELSIVLIIIGLLVSGVLAGRDLIEQAKLRGIANEWRSYETAIRTFQLKYDGMPGDLDNAANYWGATSNGDDNGLVEYGNEDRSDEGETLTFWQQLSLAGLVDGNYSGALVSSDFETGTNVPASAYNASYGWSFYSRVRSTPWGVYGKEASTFEYGDCTPYGGETPNACAGPTMTAATAQSLDSKIDDGLADSGKMYGTDGYNGPATQVTGCAGDWDDASGTYDLDNTTIACRLFFWWD